MSTPTDQNVSAVRDKLRDRARTGFRKYGVTTERGDLSTLEWLNHAQQEAMDLCVYLERLIRDEGARLLEIEEAQKRGLKIHIQRI